MLYIFNLDGVRQGDIVDHYVGLNEEGLAGREDFNRLALIVHTVINSLIYKEKTLVIVDNEDGNY